jgi:HPt (histidine-containing phosphotransfer) domain-containing protein
MLDIELLAEKLEFDLEDVQMLLNMFIENANESMMTLKDAIEQNNFKEMKNSSHAIKGSASNLMLEEITQISADMEEFAENGLDADYRSLFTNLTSELEILQKTEVLS